MDAQTITLHLPKDVMQRFQGLAEAVHWPLEKVVYQTIRGNLPPQVDDLPPEFRSELADLQSLDDRTLWATVRETLPPEQWRRHQDLLQKNEAGALTADEQTELTRLRTITDLFVFRRSYALALLKWRGYTLSLS